MASNNSGPPKSSREDVLKFLDELDNLSPGSSAALPVTSDTTTAPDEAQSALDFLNDLTQRSSTPVPPAAAPPRTSSDITRTPSRGNLKAPGSAASSPITTTATTASPRPTTSSNATPSQQVDEATTSTNATKEQTGSWGWSSVWTSASSALQQASKVVADHEPQEQAKKWTSGMLGSLAVQLPTQLNLDVEHLKERGFKAMTEIINAVAPPIAEHESIQVWLSHDMVGYDGVESLVYRSLSRVLEQVEGGDLQVHSANVDESNDDRNLNTVDGFQEAHSHAVTLLEQVLASHPPEQIVAGSKKNADLPITICPVYMRIQALLAPLPWAPAGASTSTSNDASKQLYFIMLLRDPTHSLEHETVTQPMPAKWLDIPFEENEWMENEMVEVIRKGVELLGQDYVRTRQSGTAPSSVESEA